MHDREQPLARAFAAAPILQMAERPFQAILDEIVGTVGIPEQRTRIAAQPGDLLQDRTAPVVHARRSHRFRSADFSRFRVPVQACRSLQPPAGTWLTNVE